MMRMYDIIQKKQRGIALSENEISFFIKGVSDGSIPDYQISALLMAIYFRGMTDEETITLTEYMANSGGPVPDQRGESRQAQHGRCRG